MLIEQRVYRLLNENKEFTSLLDKLRGKKFDSKGDYDNAIFLDDIPENFAKAEKAPFMRINTVSEMADNYADDSKFSETQTVQIDWWCANANHSEQIKKLVDEILEANNFGQYYSDRYKDPDIKLKMNVRKYKYTDFEM